MTSKAKLRIRLIAAVLCAVLAVVVASVAIVMLCNTLKAQRVKDEKITFVDAVGEETSTIDSVEFECYSEML